MIKLFIFSYPVEKQAAALHPSKTNDLHVSTATSLHESVPLSSSPSFGSHQSKNKDINDEKNPVMQCNWL